MERDQLLERAALVELGVVEAADHDVGDVREAVGAQQVLGRRRREVRQRVLALDAPLVEVAARRRPRARRAVLGRAHEQPADVRMLAQRRDQLGVALLDLLAASAAAAPPSGRSARGCPSPGRRRRGSETSFLAASRRLRPVASVTRVADHRRLLVAAGEPGDRAARERALDQVVEPVAVALLERRALGLAVIGEDDDLVRARRVAARALDPRELLVELAQRLERVGALEPGVVGDLVVAREGRVDGRAGRASCRSARRTRSGRGRPRTSRARRNG